MSVVASGYYIRLQGGYDILFPPVLQRFSVASRFGGGMLNANYSRNQLTASIGLHARDNVKLIKALKDLRDLGNSVIVVEHDKEMMLESDYIFMHTLLGTGDRGKMERAVNEIVRQQNDDVRHALLAIESVRRVLAGRTLPRRRVT